MSVTRPARTLLTSLTAASILCLVLSACQSQLFTADKVDGYAPGLSGKSDLDGLRIGHRLMASGEYELALKAYTRAAAQRGLTPDTLSAIGSANLRLGRLHQAERLLRRAAKETPDFAAAWNNLGVVLMERGKIAEASEIFRRAFATDSGKSDQIRKNLSLALAKLNSSDTVSPNTQSTFKLVRRGAGDFVLLTAL